MSEITSNPIKHGSSDGMERRLIPVLIVASACIIALLYVWPVTQTLLERREWITLDGFHLAGNKTPARSDIVVLGIDDASLKLDSAWPEDIEASPALQAMKTQWPWPRRVWAEVLDRLFAAGARQVFIDITFKSPSADPESDRLFREALERHRGKVVLGMKFEDSTVGNATVTQLVMPTEAITGPNPEKTNTGILTLWPERDERIHSIHWLVTPSEAEALNSDGEVVADPMEESVPAVSLVLAHNIQPGADRMMARKSRIRFCAADAYEPVSLFQLFIPSLWEGNLANGEIFRGKTVLIGAVASDLQDYQFTPVGRLSGVQVHAHALTARLAKSFLRPSPGWGRWLMIFAGAWVAWLLIRYVRLPVLGVGGLALAAIGAHFFSQFSFNWVSLEVSAQPFILCLGLCGVAGMTGSAVLRLREKRKLQQFLARYTSPQLAKEMMADRDGLYTTLGGVERRTTMFFSDIRGFTSLSEKMTPAQLVGQLNEYLSAMVACVFRRRGLVDKFIGDAIMALWGSTRSQPSEEGFRDDAIAAVSAALDMRRAIVELNLDWKRRGMAELRFGMGIHQGAAVVGNIGSAAPYEKMDLTVIGDAVNLASRLEGATKQYQVDMLVTEAIHQHVKDLYLCRRVDLIAVKGKAKPVEVFTILGPTGTPAPEGLPAFEEGITHYRSGCFEQATGAFQRACALGLDDALTQVYLSRCSELAAHPPADWHGVFVMTTK